MAASAAAVEMVPDEERVHLAALSGFMGKAITLSTEPTMIPE